MSNVDIVKEIYEAFGRGDVPAILDKLDQNVGFDTQSSLTEVPWLRPRRGTKEVVEFFQSLEPLEFNRFEPHTFFAEGDKVVAMVDLEVTYKPTGKKYGFPTHGHLWQFDPSGKVTEMAHLTDTHQWVRMVRGE